jgi:hypothetical protein
MSDGTEPRFANYKRTTIHSSGERTEDTVTVAVPTEWTPVTIEHGPDGTTCTDLLITKLGMVVFTETVDDTTDPTST